MPSPEQLRSGITTEGNTMKRTIILAIGTAAILLTLTGQALASNSDAITRAAYANDLTQLDILAQENTGYDRAYAFYREAQLRFSSADQNLQPILDQATAILTPMEDPEAKVLLAAVHNLTMGLSPQRAAQLAPEVEQLLNAAKEDDKTRGRALLIEGINRFYTPAAYGGGAESARERLQQAAEHFAHGKQQATEVTWGEAETHVWLGQVYAAMQQPKKAREHYQQALAVDPPCPWAHYYMDQL